jgi:hypothetical protein
MYNIVRFCPGSKSFAGAIVCRRCWCCSSAKMLVLFQRKDPALRGRRPSFPAGWRRPAQVRLEGFEARKPDGEVNDWRKK